MMLRPTSTLLVLLVTTQLADQTSVAPDGTGLVGTPYYYDVQSTGPNAVRLPLKFWEKTRDSALRPRRRDRDPLTLMKLLGAHYDPRWMRRSKKENRLLNVTSNPLSDMQAEEERRPSVQALWEAAMALQPPTIWPSPPPGIATSGEPSSEVPTAWLVALATCPSKEEWRDLGVFFWPRRVRRVECERGPARRKPGSSSKPLGCGWPSGRLTCAPGATRTLHLLHWHCRLRDPSEDAWARLAQVMSKGKVPPQPPQRRKRRERYRCEWLKVPYPVPADCQCGGLEPQQSVII